MTTPPLRGSPLGAPRPWRNALLPVLGLLVAIAAVGVAGIAINQSITNLVEDALSYDLELEDNADDLRVAVLDVRHYHRDLIFNDPSPPRVREFEARYAELLAQVDELAELGVRDPEAPQPSELRAIAESYFAAFRPAIDRFAADPELFDERSLEGLERLAEIDQAAAELDRLGEELAASAFAQIEEATRNALLVLVVVLAGLVAIGALLGLVVVRLVEESRLVAEREQAAARQLAEVSQAKTDFIADASHELRTPLTVLRGNAEVGLAIASDCGHEEILREIVGEAARMSRLVENLLFLARSDATSVPLEIQGVDGAAFVDELAGRAEVLARERGSELETSLDVRGQLRIDPVRMQQAVLVLVDNAAKYAPGSPIRLTAAVADGALELAVTDRGPGIPEAELDRVFERFHRAARTGTGGGMGIGLSIAQRVVDGHGGRIGIASRVGEGTTVTIRVPVSASVGTSGEAGAST